MAVETEVVRVLRDLIRFDTTNPPGNERPAVDYAAQKLRAAGASFEIVEPKPARASLVARLKGVTDRNAAEALTNVRLYVAREKLPQPDADEFYHADLVGLTAQKHDGEIVGTVKAVHNFGAGDLIEIEPTNGATIMLPFDEVTVPVVDIAAKKIVIEPPTDS